MANLLDYLAWRGDIPFSEDAPFNEVDGMILARLSYLPMYLFNWSEGHRLDTLCKRMQTLSDDKFRLPEDIDLIAALQNATRFENLLVTDYQRDLLVSAEKQFCAVTIHLGETELYLSFCGTDGTWTGWKEDWNMSFMGVVPSQKEALSYTKAILKKYPETKIRLGGHSKGGNLAGHVAARLPKAEQDQIIRVCSMDGPGYSETFVDSSGFKRVADRTFVYSPEDSWFGRIMTHSVTPIVVHSTATMLDAHNPYTWEVLGAQMVRSETGPSTFSDLSNIANRLWMDNTSPAERKLAIDVIFDFLMAGGWTFTRESADHWIKTAPQYIMKLATLPPEQGKRVLLTLMEVGKSYATGLGETAKNMATDMGRNVLDQLSPAMKDVLKKIWETAGDGSLVEKEG